MTSTDERLLQAVLRSNFTAFVQKSFNTLSPGQVFIPNWHINAIAYQLDRVRRGEVRRLIINMPPRSLKSIMASVAFPAFVLGQTPSRRLICVSYSGELAKKHSNDFRALIESLWYRDLFPGTRVGPYKNSETEIEFTERGYRLATSVGGTLTGRGGEIIIIDDPLKPDDAMSEVKRNAANQWFMNTLLSRLDDKRTGAIIIVMQRVHMDDLTGFVLEQSPDWEVLNLPAIAEYEQTVRISPQDCYVRDPGTALFPDREPLDVLEAMKLQIGSDAFSAQYQQMPVPPGGAMIKREWIRRYQELPSESRRLFTLQSWDTASKGGPDNDWSVCTTWHVTKDHRWYLADVFRKRLDYPSLKAAVLSVAKQWKASRILIEDTGAGTALLQELRARIPVIAVRPQSDKASRMAVVSSKFEAGNVFFPERARWLLDLESELFSFPGSRHDDQCDSISQGLSDEYKSFMRYITPELLERASRPPVSHRLVAFRRSALPRLFLLQWPSPAALTIN